MSTRSVTIATIKHKTQSDSCGCTPHDQICCQLDCLERPRFFCGQMLTDQDLTAVLTWAQDKLRLHRFKHGWGVVCGLEVSPHPDNSGRVVVSAGYAVDCCGDDIVVCAEREFDLSNACRPREEDCAELRAPSEDAYREEIHFGGQGYTAANVDAVDLYIHYHEAEANPQTALGRSACREVAACEYSRMRETYTLAWRPADGSGPSTEVAERWRTEYEEWVAEQAGRLDAQEALFRIMQRFHAAPLPGDCSSCLKDTGVPLARIWLLKPEIRRDPCIVLAVDAYPPYRRPFMVEPWPAPPGQVNLARFLWQRWDSRYNTVSGALADLGIHVTGKQSIRDEDARRALVSANVFWSYDEPLTVLTVDMQALGWRVVGFRAAGENGDNSGEAVEYVERPTPARSGADVEGGAARDDLTDIRGIGPSSVEALHAQGYSRFADVAELTPQQLRNLLRRPISDEDLTRMIAQAGELAR